MKRATWNKCVLEVEERTPNGWSYPIPMQKCSSCGKERVDPYTAVLPLIEAPNLFRTPMYDCVCSKGNEQHRKEWKDSIENLRQRLEKEWHNN